MVTANFWKPSMVLSVVGKSCGAGGIGGIRIESRRKGWGYLEEREGRGPGVLGRTGCLWGQNNLKVLRGRFRVLTPIMPD